MSEEAKKPTKVFISYSWDSEEHKNRVLRVANTLRDPWGIETDIDWYVRARPPFTPLQGWDLWMEKRIEWAEFVLIVCTETYKRRFRGDEQPGIGRGVTWEGTIIRQHLYDQQLHNTKFIPVVFSSQDLIHVPIVLNSRDKYILEDKESFRTLGYRLRKEPMIAIPEIAAGELPSLPQPEFFTHSETSIEPPPVSLDVAQIEALEIIQVGAGEQAKSEALKAEEISTANESANKSKIDLSSIARKELQEYNAAKIFFIKNVKDPNRWAYSLDLMQYPESRVFELMWRTGSHGANQPKVGDLMILHQRAKVTHVVEFLHDQARQTDSGSFRWVRTVWIARGDWNQLPHQKEILGFSPNYADGNTHFLGSSNFSTFREAWGNDLEQFQKHVIKQLIQPNLTATDEDNLASERGVNYTQLRDLLKAGDWKSADQETADRMCEVMGRQEEGWLREEDIEQFPCADLRTIDRLWVKYSNGRFGFSVQKKIWQECGSPTEYNDHVNKFGDRVGWCVNRSWLPYKDATFDTSALEGHLPILALEKWQFAGVRWRYALFRRTDL